MTMYTTYITSVVDYYYMRSESKGRSIHSFSFIGTTLRVGLSWLMNVGLWIEPQPKYNVVIEWILDLPCFEPRKVGIDKSHCLVFYFHNFQAQTIIYYINISEIRTPNDCCSVKVYKNDVAPSPRKWWWERSII